MRDGKNSAKAFLADDDVRWQTKHRCESVTPQKQNDLPVPQTFPGSCEKGFVCFSSVVRRMNLVSIQTQSNFNLVPSYIDNIVMLLLSLVGKAHWTATRMAAKPFTFICC